MEHLSSSSSPYVHRPGLADDAVNNEAYASCVSWSAVIGGAFVAAALSLILLALGTGLGLSSVSPWSNVGASASTMGTATVIWMIMIQIIASAMGGYLAGRLRTKWVNVHTDEVFFRDTAHGFLVWAVGLVLSASLLASASVALVGGGGQLGATTLSTAGGAAMAVSQAEGLDFNPKAYFVDILLSTNRPGDIGNDAAVRAEAGRIFALVLRQKEVPAVDRTRLAHLVAARTGISQAEAETRVSEVIAQANSAATEERQAADAARKAAAHVSLWLFLALLIGAYCASYAATIGGRQRDHVIG